MNFYCKIHTIIVLIFIHNLFTKVQFYATTIVVMRRLLNYGISVSHTGCLYKFVRAIKMIQFNDEPFSKEKVGSFEPTPQTCINTSILELFEIHFLS